jgi:hypothetical protein
MMVVARCVTPLVVWCPVGLPLVLLLLGECPGWVAGLSGVGRHSYVSVERRAESGERRGNKNSKFDIPKKDNLKNRLEYTRNILESAKNSRKRPISVEGKGPEFGMVSLSLEPVRWLN